MSTIVLSGINGQDGSFLAESLLKEGHNVVGIVRRSAMEDKKLENIEHLLKDQHLTIENGDLTDSSSIWRIIQDYKPHEFYNLAAQSHVGASFTSPESTTQINATGVLHCLEAIRNLSPQTRFYQASTSEMFGDNMNAPQSESTTLSPNSPYAVAKVYAHNLVINYRKAYGLHACSGILFNHECLTENTPVIVRNIKSGMLDIKSIDEIVPHRTNFKHGKKYSTIAPCDYEVWDGTKWSKILTRTATWNDQKNDKKIRRVMARGGMYEATADHVSFKKGAIEVPTRDLKVDDELELKELPPLNRNTITSLEEAEFLGLMVAEGYCKKGKARFTNKDTELCERVKYLWARVSGGYSSEYYSCSGFTGKKDIKNINLFGNPAYLNKMYCEIYTQNGYKKIPAIILNSENEVIDAFMKGYLIGDGTKSLYREEDYQSLTTNSQVLAAGLWYIFSVFYGRRLTLHPEERKNSIYYRININNENNQGKKSRGPIKPLEQIKKITELSYEGWVYDLETDSGTFSAGIGFTWVHNSPRRGEQFVTRKITKAAARIKLGLQTGLSLGNLDARRDWGYAKEYVEGMKAILRHDIADDYVLATGETHTIRQFIDYVSEAAGFNLMDYVSVSQSNMRPSEVPLLLGDPSKAKRVLGWEAKIKAKDLARIMYNADLQKEQKDVR